MTLLVHKLINLFLGRSNHVVEAEIKYFYRMTINISVGQITTNTTTNKYCNTTAIKINLNTTNDVCCYNYLIVAM